MQVIKETKIDVTYKDVRHSLYNKGKITREEAMNLLSGMVRKYRWELFRTYAGYRIVTNGYKEFTLTRLDDRDVPARVILDKLETLLKEDT